MTTRLLIPKSFSFLVLAFSFGMLVTSCGEKTPKKQDGRGEKVKQLTREDTLSAKKDSLNINSEYELETVDPKHQEEFIENLAKIEKEFGEQWGFCECIVRNDSVQKAFQSPNISDAEFDALDARSTVIANRCKAFLVQSMNQTPEERYEHKKKVNACLKEAGLK